MPLLSTAFNRENRKLSIWLIAAALPSIAFPVAVGIMDRLFGIIIFIVGLALIVLALFHYRWKNKAFIIILIASETGFILFGVFHNLFEAMAQSLEEGSLMQDIGTFISVTSFLIAVFVCPLGLITGLVGTVVTYFKK